MPDGCKWMKKYHPWPRPSHDFPDSFLHLRPIAMCRALLAGRLIITVTAAVKSALCIIQQIPATWA